MSTILLEACVDSVESALAAQAGGADRVELCANLLEGGTTPSAATIELARRNLSIGLNVMVRPRGGDFCYSDVEFAVMQRDLEIAKSLGADAVVIGLLNRDGTVDAVRTGQLVEAARPMSVTFHRAFDMVADPADALDVLIELGVDRVLTSGQEPSALEGSDTIAALIRQAAERIVVMAGGGINERNASRIRNLTGVRELHVSLRVPVDSPMEVRNHRVVMGGSLHPPEFQIMATAAARIQACRAVAQSAVPSP